jgi:hypothetical protein
MGKIKLFAKLASGCSLSIVLFMFLLITMSSRGLYENNSLFISRTFSC